MTALFNCLEEMKVSSEEMKKKCDDWMSNVVMERHQKRSSPASSLRNSGLVNEILHLSKLRKTLTCIECVEAFVFLYLFVKTLLSHF